MLDSKALTKIQSIILIAIVVVAGVGGAAYVFWDGPTQSSETIKIGVCTDLGSGYGDATLQGAIMATEQINAKGGILGKQIELIKEDTDFGSTSFDPSSVSTAINRLITYDKVDFVIGGLANDDNAIIQDSIAQHKKIFISVSAPADYLTERVLADYEKYKYFFKVAPPNSTALSFGYADSFVALREYTGFNKIAYLAMDFSVFDSGVQNIESLAELYGFDLVYGERFPPGTIDFSSYFAQIESSGAEILAGNMFGDESIAFIKEWYDRQSPVVIWGSNLASSDFSFWEITDGKCEYETVPSPAVMAGYPVTNYTLAVRNAYIDRWGAVPSPPATAAYDIIRFILPNAIERAGTTETEAVLNALEEVDLKTSTSQRFLFLDSHDVMYGPGYDVQYFFQWQDGKKVIIYPRELKEEAGSLYMFPDWSGPWDDLD